MVGEITPIRGAKALALPQKWEPPAVTRELRGLIGQVERGVENIDLGMVAAVQDEIGRLLAETLEPARPVTPEFVFFWLTQLMLSTPLPAQQTADDMKRRAVQIAEDVAAEEYPAACFTAATRRRAASRFKFFPGMAELVEFLSETAGELRGLRRGLRAVAGLARTKVLPNPDSMAGKTKAEVDHIVAAIYAKHDFTPSGPPASVTRIPIRAPVRSVEEQLAVLHAATKVSKPVGSA